VLRLDAYLPLLWWWYSIVSWGNNWPIVPGATNVKYPIVLRVTSCPIVLEAIGFIISHCFRSQRLPHCVRSQRSKYFHCVKSQWLSHCAKSHWLSHCAGRQRCWNITLCREPAILKFPIIPRTNSYPIVLGASVVKVFPCQELADPVMDLSFQRVSRFPYCFSSGPCAGLAKFILSFRRISGFFIAKVADLLLV